MSLLLAGEIYAAWCVFTALMVLFSFATWDWLRDMDAQRRMDTLVVTEAAGVTKRAEAARAPDLFALALEEIRNLPSREHS